MPVGMEARLGALAQGSLQQTTSQVGRLLEYTSLGNFHPLY